MSEQQNQVPPGRTGTVAYRPQLAFHKPNMAGTGSALRMELHPAHDDVDGCFMVRLARQSEVGDRRASVPVYPRFDWENSVWVKLDFTDLCAMLQVFRGECESINADKGVVHRSPAGLTYIHLRHQIEPQPGYVISVKRVFGGRRPDVFVSLMLTSAEATGLVAAIENSMSVICFGIPVVIERDRSKYRQAVKEMCNGRDA